MRILWIFIVVFHFRNKSENVVILVVEYFSFEKCDFVRIVVHFITQWEFTNVTRYKDPLESFRSEKRNMKLEQ